MLEGELQYIKEAQGGNGEAFGKLYHYYLPKIYRFVLLKVNNKGEADDLVHEVFMSAWQHIHSYASRGFPFSSWVYQIARNKIIDSYRTKKQHLRLDDFEDTYFKVPERQSKELNNTLDLERVQSFIKLLKQDHQDVLIMRFVDDLSHQEIASAIGKSEGAVRLIQHRALQNLKAIIEEHYGPIT